MTNAARKDEIRLLSAQIKNGAITPLIDKYLDDLLRWLVGAGTETELDTGFSRFGIAQDQLRTQLTQLLDQYLFAPANSSYSVLGLAPGAGQPEIKARYYRLLKVFHPDRQQDNLPWWTDRAERLNRAYAALKSGKATEEIAIELSQGAPRQPYGDYPQSTYRSAAMGRLRQSLGRGRQFQFRFFAAAALVSAGLLVYIYARNAPIGTLEGNRVTAQPASGAAQQSMKGHVVHRLEAVENPDHALVSHAEPPAPEAAIERPDNEPPELTPAAIDAVPETDDTTEPPVTALSFEPALTEEPSARTVDELAMTTAPLEEVNPESAVREHESDEIRMDLKIAGLVDVIQDLKSVPLDDTAPMLVETQETQMATSSLQPAPSSRESTPPPSSSVDRPVTENPSAGSDEVQIAKALIMDPSQAINGLFDQFSTWYRQGNAQDLSNLFLEDAVDGSDIGKTRIKDAYQTIFDNTTSRELSFFIDNIEPRENGSFLVELRYRASLNYTQRGSKILQDEMKVWIQKSGDAYQFKRLAYAK